MIAESEFGLVEFDEPPFADGCCEECGIASVNPLCPSCTLARWSFIPAAGLPSAQDLIPFEGEEALEAAPLARERG